MNSSDQPGPGNGNDGIHPWIDPDLEARIVAAVVGEASDFEKAELDRMLEKEPELAVFKRRIEAVHGLVGESFSQPEANANDDEWRMDPEKRSHLLNKLGLSPATEATAEAEEEASDPAEAPRSSGRWKVWMTALSSSAAALVAIAAFVFTRVESLAPVQAVFATNDVRYSGSESSSESYGFGEVREAGRAAAGSRGSSLGYQESLARLSEETSLGDTESLVTRFGRPSMQTGGSRRNIELQKLRIDGNVSTADKSIHNELALAPQQSATPVTADTSEPGNGIPSDNATLGLPAAPALPSLTTAVPGAEIQEQIADTSRPTSASKRTLFEDVDQLSDLEVAQVDEKVASDYSFRTTTAEVQASSDQLNITTRSGIEANQVVTRSFIDPTESKEYPLDTVPSLAKEVAGKPTSNTNGIDSSLATPSSGIDKIEVSEPISTAGKVALNDFKLLADEYQLPTAGADVVIAKDAASTGGAIDTLANGLQHPEDRFDVDLESTPEIVEFEGFLNYGNDDIAKREADTEQSERVYFAGGTTDDLALENKPSSNWSFTPPTSSPSSVPRGSNPLTSGIRSGNEAIPSDQIDGLIARQRSLATDPSRSEFSSLPTTTIETETRRAGELGGHLGGAGKAINSHLYGDSAVTVQVSDAESQSSDRTEGLPDRGVSELFADSQLQEVKQQEPELRFKQQAVVDFEDGAVAMDENSEVSADAASFAVAAPDSETFNFGAGFSTTDNLKGFVDVTGPATEPSVALAESLVAEEGRRNLGQQKLKREADRSDGSPGDFDQGVGNAPDGSISLLSEKDLKQEQLLEKWERSGAGDSIELARTQARKGEYDAARAILTGQLAEAPGNDQAARRLIAENDEAVRNLTTTLESKLSESQRKTDDLWGAPEPNTSPPTAGTETARGGASTRLFRRDGKDSADADPDADSAEKPITELAARLEAEKSVLDRRSVRLSDTSGHDEVTRENEELAVQPSRSPETAESESVQKLASISANYKDFQEARKNLWAESGKEFAPVTTTEELASENAFSTFSLNVSDVAFKLAQSALASGEWPEPDKMRVEEFVNALDYGDPSPAPGEKVTCKTEQCTHPFMQQRNLLRIAMQTAAVGRGGGQPLRLTILLDHSGSMQREDREASVQRAMQLLTEQLQPSDQVSLIGFARTPRLLADRISGSDGDKLNAAVAAAPSEGGTNLEEALRLAAEVAQRQFDDGAVNRIVLMTDGAANLGNANPEELATRVVELRQKGIAFDACGVGAKGLNDEVLEALTRKGDGRYYFLDAPEQADSGFASQLAGALRPAAKNVKVQVIFNPERVGAYRLIGYEKHRLKKEDFRNDAVDAAEMAAEEAGIAMYQFEPKADGTGEVGEVLVRFQDVASGQMIEHKWIIPFEKNTPSISEASPSIQLAATAAMLGEYLRGGPEASNVELDTLNSLTPNLRNSFGASVRVHQLIEMIRNARMAK